MTRRFCGRRPRHAVCADCGEQLSLYSWSEADINPSGRVSVRTYVYIHPSTGSIDKRDETGRIHYASS